MLTDNEGGWGAQQYNWNIVESGVKHHIPLYFYHHCALWIIKWWKEKEHIDKNWSYKITEVKLVWSGGVKQYHHCNIVEQS